MNLLNASKLASYTLLDEDQDAVSRAIHSLNSGKVSLIGFSGKKGSGKDTIAGLFKSKFENDFGPAEFSPFGDAVKSESTDIINLIRFGVKHQGDVEKQEIIQNMCDLHSLTNDEANTLYDLVEEPLSDPNEALNGWSRTQSIWTFLRTLGTDIRQPQDKIYWVRETVHSIISNANNGISTIVQDVRFLHEVTALKDANSYVARIDITPEAQLRRLASRDGVTPTVEALSHSSETQLDDYPHFNIRVDNSADSQQEIAAETIYQHWLETSKKAAR